MGKTVLLATAIVIGVAIIWGLPGILWARVFAVPIGIALWILAKLLKWM
jgi:hypothetical protein